MDEQAIVTLVPSAEDGDADGVKMSLEAARALAMSGEPQEALRLLRRAAEAAEQAGDDMRSIQLARAAADIANEVERAKRVGAEASDGKDDAKKHPPRPPSRPPKSVPTPPSTPAATTGAQPHGPPPPGEGPPYSPTSSGKNSPQAVSLPLEEALDELGAAHAEIGRGESHTLRSSPQATHEPPHAQPSEPAAPSPQQALRPAPAGHAASALPPGMNELLAQGRAVRVLVKRSARDESLYIVRPHATTHVPVGAREAFLVLGDADPDFLSGATR